MAPNENVIPIINQKNVPRIDGALKVSGKAEYTADVALAHMAYAVPVGATIAKGKITSIDKSAAEKIKGVLGVYSHGTIGALYRPAPEDGFMAKIDEPRPPFEDEVIRYYGQYVAVVVAETLELARAGAAALKITYHAEQPNLDEKLEQDVEKKTESERGDTKTNFKSADVKLDHTYVTPIEVHNPIEMHATVADWTGPDKVTLYETTQAITPHRNVMAQILGLPIENVRVISKFLGSGFGGKLWPWNHSALAAATARKINRPVKLVIDRTMMFTNVGHRARTQQRIQIGAKKDGRLVSLQHDYANQTSILENYKENCGEMTAMLYSCPNVLVTSGQARRNQPVPTSMRGPGAVPGLFALESAMDELAVQLKMDPIQLRLLNEPDKDESKGLLFSSRHLKECMEVGAEKFGWSKRNPEVGSMRHDDEILGWGMAACSWPARRLACQATVEFHANGRVKIVCGTQDIGTGTYTALAQIANTELGIPMDKIDVVLGDTELPMGPISGGSMATASIVPAVFKACHEAIKNLKSSATKAPDSPYFQQKPDDLKYEKGKVSSGSLLAKSHDFSELMKKANLSVVVGRGQSQSSMEGKQTMASYSFGAQFLEIGWQPELARLRVKRTVSVIDGGKIINFAPARNQIEGAVIMGIGMGMFEHAIYDRHYGNPVNNNLADYILTTHADAPEQEVVFLDYPDKNLNEYGARGVGEIGLAGVAAAICGAVYHATGVRVRELPVKIEDLLKS